MLVGRDDEVGRLGELLEGGLPVLVTGEPGVGKTSLVRHHLTTSGHSWREGGAFSVLSWVPYLALRRAVGLELPSSPDVATVVDAGAMTAEVEERLAGAVLVLDDLQWADPGTLEVAALLAGRVPVVAIARSSGPGAEQVRDQLVSGARYEELSLDGLDPGAIEELARQRRPELGPLATARLVARSGGNPLIAEELLSANESDPPATLGLALDARLRTLEEPTAEAFEQLALAGRPVPRSAFSPRVVADLAESHLAVVEGTRLAVRHELIAEHAIAGLSDERRAAHHAALGEVFADDPASAAGHLLAAGDLTRARLAALDAAGRSPHPLESARHLAVAAQASAGLEAHALRLRAAAGLAAAGEMSQVLSVLGDEPPPEPDQAAAWHLLRSRARWGAGDMEGFVEELHAGLAHQDSAPPAVLVRLRVEALREPAFLRSSSTDLDRAVDDARAVLDLAVEHGVEVARARYMLGTILYLAAVPEWEHHLEQARREAVADGDIECELLAANNLVTAHESAGDPARGRAVAREMIARCRELRARAWQHQFEALLLNLEMHAGNLELAVRSGIDLLGEALEMRTRQQVEITVAWSLIGLGHFDLVRPRLDEMATTTTVDWMGRANLLFLLADYELSIGRPRLALTHLEEMTELASAELVALAAPLGAWARFELGEEIPYASAPDDSGPGPVWGVAAAEVTALADLVRGDHRQARLAFDRAATRYAPLQRRGELRCRLGAAMAASRGGEPDDAKARLLALEAQADDLGMGPLVERARQELRQLGVRRAAPRAVRRDARALTSREEELLRLVAQGLTDGEIARRLALSPATVKSTIRSAMHRLGATSRGQAVLALAG